MPKLEVLPEHLPISHQSKCAVLHVKGFIDAPNYDTFVKQLEQASKANFKFVVIDMASLQYINSTGVSALIKWQGQLSGRGGALVLAHVPRSVGVSLDLLGLTTVVPLVKDVEKAKKLMLEVEEGRLPAGGLQKAQQIEQTHRRIPVWPQKALTRKKSSVVVLVPKYGYFTEVLKMRLQRANALFHVFHSPEEALKKYNSLSPEVVIVDSRLDPRGTFLARVKLDKGKSLSSIIRLYPKGTNVHKYGGFRIWENDYLIDPFEVMELFSLAETELRRIPEERQHSSQEIRYVFKSSQNRIDQAQNLTFKLLSQSGLQVDSLDLMFKAFKEALDNAVRHGNSWDSQKEIEVIYLLEDNRVRIQVADQGEGFDYEFYLGWSLMSHALQDAKRKIVKEGRKGGLGILLMRRCTDKLEYRGSGNVLWLEKKIA